MTVLDVAGWLPSLEAWAVRWHEDEAFAPPAEDEFVRLLAGLHRQNFFLWPE